VQAGRALHTLKGLAATVGARHLAQVAAQLEKAVKAGAEAHTHSTLVGTLRSAIDALADTLVPVLNAYQEGQQPASAPQVPPAALVASQQAQLNRELQTLVRLLNSSDMVAMDVFTALDKAFGAQLDGALDPLRSAMNGLDFGAAAAHCQALLNEKS
jgi:two-component system sensor histidine kinase/response regulator